jgi:hypothetical protein
MVVFDHWVPTVKRTVRRIGHSKLMAKDGKIVKVDNRLTMARTKVVLASCSFVKQWEAAEHDKVMEAGTELASLRRSVHEFWDAVAEDEKGRKVISGGNSLSLTGAVWSNLSINDKLLLLKAAYPQRSPALIAFEANKTWKNLLPSTQSDLNKVDWSLTIGRDVTP